MKKLGEFNASCLRPRQPRDWRWGLSCLIAGVLSLIGMLCLAALMLLLSGHNWAQQTFTDSAQTQPALAAAALACLIIARLIRKRSLRRRLAHSHLNLAPHLLKKHH